MDVTIRPKTIEELESDIKLIKRTRKIQEELGKDTSTAEQQIKEIEARIQELKAKEVSKEVVDEAPVTETKEVTEEVVEEAPAETSEVEANQVVYKMNKTDKKIWSKDFEIVDNRKGQEEALIDEEGNKTSDKWLVVNKVTGETLTVGTKKDAQNIIANAPAYAETFGDGQTVESENIITPTEVTEENIITKTKEDAIQIVVR